MHYLEHRVLRIEPILIVLYEGELVRVLNLRRDKNHRREPRRDGKILSDTGCCAYRVLLNIPVVHVCLDITSRSADEQFHNNAPHLICRK